VTIDLVESCGSHGTECKSVGEVLPKGEPKITAAINFTDTQVVHMLQELRDDKVIRFSTMVKAFGGFESREKK